MPLKHGVETLMVFILGLMIALAGAVVAFLPPISVAVLPWATAFVVSLLYPLALYPMMKERRAEYEFRALHFAPASILLAWLALDILAASGPDRGMPQSLYAWGWATPAVVAAFIALALFCMNVVRRRAMRLKLLATLLLPFLILSQLSGTYDWDDRLAQVLWTDPVPTGTGVIAGGGASSNLSPSSDGIEEQWRAQLRRMERRRRRLEELADASSSTGLPVSGAKTGTVIAAGGLSEEDGPAAPPPHLPSSGFGAETMAPIVLAAYCAAVQRKTQKRARA